LIYIQAFKRGLKPDPALTITEWSDKYRYLAGEGAAEPGRYRSSRVPYLIEPMNELSPSSDTQEVVIIKPTQVGCTELANNFIMCIAHLYPGPCLFVLPTVDMAEDHSKTKVTPSLEHMICLKDIIKPIRSKDSNNTILRKAFPGGSWTFCGANSPTSMRSKSIRYLIMDDLDEFKKDVGGKEGGQGYSIDLFMKRTDSYGRKKKVLKISTPTVKELSNIEIEYKKSSQGKYHVPCPHCGGFQYLEWGGKDCKYGIKFTHNEDKVILDICYVCKHCGKRIDESEKSKMLENGHYVHKYPDRKIRGFKINSLYSPSGWVSWSQIATEFLDINKDREKLKVFVNTRLAETFDEGGDQPDWVFLTKRAEPYDMISIPSEVRFITMGTDTQDDRLISVIRGWGKYEQSWLVYWGELFGDPDQDEVWQQHDKLLNRAYERADGAKLYIISAAIDSGGHRTQAVYRYCRTRAPRVMCIKGASTLGKPLVNRPTAQDVTWGGQLIKGGVQLWTLGTDTAKSLIYNRLKQEDKQSAGYYHFPIGLTDEYYMQFTAEKMVTRYSSKGFPISEYIKTRHRNDVLDAEIYAYCAAIRAGMAFMDWAKEDINKNIVNLDKNRKKPVKREEPARSSFMS